MSARRSTAWPSRPSEIATATCTHGCGRLARVHERRPILPSEVAEQERYQEHGHRIRATGIDVHRQKLVSQIVCDRSLVVSQGDESAKREERLKTQPGVRILSPRAEEVEG